MTGFQPGPTPDPATNPTPAEPGTTPDTEAGTTPEKLITLAEAAALAGVTVGALRKRYRTGDLERRYDETGRVLLDASAVCRLYRVSQDTPHEPETPIPQEEEPATVVAPPGSVLVPVSSWEKMLEQLGNLHQAGQEVAEARERAARAEEREAFAQERRREAQERAAALEAELSMLRNAEVPTPDDLTKPDIAPTTHPKNLKKHEIAKLAESEAGPIRSLIRWVRSR